MTGWNHLPPELRDMVFEEIRLIDSSWCPSLSTKPPLPQLPLICREWQHYFSHTNFRVLMLDQYRLEDFKRYVCKNKERRELLQIIMLRVKLPEYDCSVCQSPEDDNTAQLNDTIFLGTVHGLLEALSLWGDRKISKVHPYTEVMLDLGVYTPSDGQHGLRDYRFSPGYRLDAGPELYEAHELSLRQQMSDSAEQCPGWQRTCKGKSPLAGTKQRILATLCDPASPWYDDLCGNYVFPRTRRINTLSIRRHYYRHISPNAIGKILAALPALRIFRYEAWVHPRAGMQQCYQDQYMTLLRKAPKTLQRVSLVYESSKALSHSPIGYSSTTVSSRNLGIAVTSFLHRSSVQWLNISYLIDAKEITPRFGFQFSKLKTLILTAEDLKPRVEDQADVRMLQRLGEQVLRHMPQLESMEVWNKVKKDHFTLILEGVTRDTIYATWSSSWHADGALDPVWRTLRLEMVVNARHGYKKLEVARRTLQPGVFNSWRTEDGRVWEHGAPVVHGLSRRQIEYEEQAKAAVL